MTTARRASLPKGGIAPARSPKDAREALASILTVLGLDADADAESMHAAITALFAELGPDVKPERLGRARRFEPPRRTLVRLAKALGMTSPSPAVVTSFIVTAASAVEVWKASDPWKLASLPEDGIAPRSAPKQQFGWVERVMATPLLEL